MKYNANANSTSDSTLKDRYSEFIDSACGTSCSDGTNQISYDHDEQSLRKLCGAQALNDYLLRKKNKTKKVPNTNLL